ncbi:hypothetical protein NDI45_03830 [Leptolyngbya sp. GB1-A1]|uniref:hypothetical protein n=1 Tax=Leptolyngbya sp. GB1-A1 TaxID=2933908 RepID=UPI003297C7EB
MTKHQEKHHDDYDEKYTAPELRRRLKDEIMASDKGGEPGQWSARKSQLLVREYEQHGGGYKGEKDEAARSLEAWSEQDWQTEEGDDRAREGNVTKRYLPKEVWEKLTDAEKAEAERTKEEASKHGEQHVGYTPAIKRALHEVEAEHHPDSGEQQPDKKGSEKDPENRTSDKKQASKKQSESKQSETKQSDKTDKKQSQQKDKSNDSNDSEGSLSQRELYEQAKELQIAGRSKMSREELKAAIHKAKQ